MKTMMKMLAMVAVMFVAVATVAQAQDAQQQGGRRGGGRGAGMLLQGLGLDSATTAKATEIFTKYQQESMKLRQDAQAAGGQVDAAKVAEINTKRNNEVKALLNDEQKKKFDDAVAAMAARGRGPGGPPPTI